MECSHVEGQGAGSPRALLVTMHLPRVHQSLETVTVLAGNQQWDAPFLLPAKVPNASEVTLGQVKWEMLQDFPFSWLASGGSLRNTSRMGDKCLPQYLFVCGKKDCRKEKEKWSNMN